MTDTKDGSLISKEDATKAAENPELAKPVSENVTVPVVETKKEVKKSETSAPTPTEVANQVEKAQEDLAEKQELARQEALKAAQTGDTEKLGSLEEVRGKLGQAPSISEEVEGSKNEPSILPENPVDVEDQITGANT